MCFLVVFGIPIIFVVPRINRGMQKTRKLNKLNSCGVMWCVLCYCCSSYK